MIWESTGGLHEENEMVVDSIQSNEGYEIRISYGEFEELDPC